MSEMNKTRVNTPITELDLSKITIGQPQKKYTNHDKKEYLNWVPKIGGREIVFGLGKQRCKFVRTVNEKDKKVSDSLQIRLDISDPETGKKIEALNRMQGQIAKLLFDNYVNLFPPLVKSSIQDDHGRPSFQRLMNGTHFRPFIYYPVDKESDPNNPVKRTDIPIIYAKIWGVNSKFPQAVHILTKKQTGIKEDGSPIFQLGSERKIYEEVIGKDLIADVNIKVGWVTTMNGKLTNEVRLQQLTVYTITNSGDNYDPMQNPEIRANINEDEILTSEAIQSRLSPEETKEEELPNQEFLPTKQKSALPPSTSLAESADFYNSEFEPAKLSYMEE